MPSSIPTAKANLVAQLQARAGLALVQVSNGPPIPNVQREFIWVGTARGTQNWGTYGATGLRQETYELSVAVNVTREGTDQVAADTRCFALMAELEAQLKTDATINGAVMAAKVGGFELHETVTADGMTRTSELDVLVDCETWI